MSAKGTQGRPGVLIIAYIFFWRAVRYSELSSKYLCNFLDVSWILVLPGKIIIDELKIITTEGGMGR